MFELLDKRAAIKEIQKFLNIISDRVNRDVPRIAIDGIYGIETHNAVKTFQEIYGINNSGKVDNDTFDLLFLLYSEAVTDANRRDFILTDKKFPFMVGSQGNDVLIINLLINELSKSYFGIEGTNKSTYFSESTEEAVSVLQNAFLMGITGEVDAALFERMIIELKAIRRIEAVYK